MLSLICITANMHSFNVILKASQRSFIVIRLE